MPRPQRCRRVCREPEYLSFRPEEGTESGLVQLNIDEYEVLRLKKDSGGITRAVLARMKERN